MRLIAIESLSKKRQQTKMSGEERIRIFHGVSDSVPIKKTFLPSIRVKM
jgi:hypothetical protein